MARLRIVTHLSPPPPSHLKTYLITSARDGQSRPTWWGEQKKARLLQRKQEVWPHGFCAALLFGGEVAQLSRSGASRERCEPFQVGEGGGQEYGLQGQALQEQEDMLAPWPAWPVGGNRQTPALLCL